MKDFDDIEMITLSFSTYCQMCIENQSCDTYNKSMPLNKAESDYEGIANLCPYCCACI